MKTQTLLIGGLAVGVLAYMWHKKAQKPDAIKAEEGVKVITEEAKALLNKVEGTGIVPPTKQTKQTKELILKGNSVGKPNDGRAHIPKADYEKIEAKKAEIIAQFPMGTSFIENRKIKRQRVDALEKFALENKIDYAAYKQTLRRSARSRATTNNSSGAEVGSTISPKVDNETETFAFTLNF